MVQMAEHVERFDASMINDHIHTSQLSEGGPHALIGDQAPYTCDALIIATGASAKYLGLDSEESFKGRGVSACATCDGFFYRDQVVAVIGGGNTAVEEALYLSNIASKVYLVHRRDSLRSEKILQQRLFAKDNIEPLWNNQLDEVLGDSTGVTGMRIKANDGNTQEIDLAGVFIAIGHSPNTSIFADQLDMQGVISASTVAPRAMPPYQHARVFAAGDVADHIVAGHHQRWLWLHGGLRRRALSRRQIGQPPTVGWLECALQFSGTNLWPFGVHGITF